MHSYCREYARNRKAGKRREMSDHSSAITEARCFYFERQQVVLDAFSCSGYILDIGGG